MDYTCKNCHKVFSRRERKNRPMLFCSRKCLLDSGHHGKVMMGRLVGEKNGMWCGDDVGYQGIHGWIHKKFGKASKCEYKHCVYPRKNAAYHTIKAPKRFEWANISGKYLRDIKDWISLCPSCHKKYDMGLIRL